MWQHTLLLRLRRGVYVTLARGARHLLHTNPHSHVRLQDMRMPDAELANTSVCLDCITSATADDIAEDGSHLL